MSSGQFGAVGGRNSTSARANRIRHLLDANPHGPWAKRARSINQRGRWDPPRRDVAYIPCFWQPIMAVIIGVRASPPGDRCVH